MNFNTWVPGPALIATITVFYLTGNHSERIIGGIEAEKHSIPFHVGLLDKSKKEPRPFCGGALLTPFFVLTAAQCIGKTLLQNMRVLIGKFFITYVGI